MPFVRRRAVCRSFDVSQVREFTVTSMYRSRHVRGGDFLMTTSCRYRGEAG